MSGCGQRILTVRAGRLCSSQALIASAAEDFKTSVETELGADIPQSARMLACDASLRC